MALPHGPAVWRILLATALLAGASAHAQLALPVEIRQIHTPYNLQSTNGVPISSTRDSIAGSDGRLPTTEQQRSYRLTEAAASPRQFRGATIFSAVAAPRPVRPVGSSSANPSDVTGETVGDRAAEIGQPRIQRRMGSVTHVLLRAQVGAPYVSRRLDYLFGSDIDPPAVSAEGVLLTADQLNAGYWLPEPFTATGAHTSKDYYWSPNAGKVYAVQPGPIQIVWKRRDPESLPPANPEGYDLVSGKYYRLMTNRYVVSTSSDPTKPQRKMYWTEASFSRLGKMIQVPAGRVGDVVVAYSETFPASVDVPYDKPNDFGFAGLTGTNDKIPSEVRTLWYDRLRGGIRAYNAEGRVLVEILGDLRSNGTREPLSIEIVQVEKQPSPEDVTIELGERIRAYDPGSGKDDSNLFPEELLPTDGRVFSFRLALAGSERAELYATRETTNLNDFWVHWLEEGTAGLRWPKRTVRYALVWPADSAKYSHYLRPEASDDAAASATAVLLPPRNAGLIEWQDSLPKTDAGEPLGAKLTPDRKFYTYLNAAHPAHRTLLRFSSADQVAFERVFSWLNTALVTQQELESSHGSETRIDSPFTGSVAANLSNWTTTHHLVFGSAFAGPRVVSAVADVGRRIGPPDGELGGNEGEPYWAGHVREEGGTDYDRSSYLDPFAVGFEEARLGSIIPVNDRPNHNHLEVWWFRTGSITDRPAFDTVYWPSVIGRYTLQWPSDPREIVLASNHGSGALSSLESKGTIYVQNTNTLAGYNPNEEHALMLGGVAYALRDDLNVYGPKAPDDAYTSDPFVLLRFTAADGRPDMTAFKVRREDPAKGWTFEYEIEAGTILQAPMPLPLLERPLIPRKVGEPKISYNRQIGFLPVDNFTPAAAGAWVTTLKTQEPHFLKPFERLSLQRIPGDSGDIRTYWFYPTNVDYGTRTLAGFLSSASDVPVAVKESALGVQNTDNNKVWRFTVQPGSASVSLAVNDTVVAVDPASRQAWSGTVNAKDADRDIIEVLFTVNVNANSAVKASTLLLRTVPPGEKFPADHWQLGSSVQPAVIAEASLREFYAGFTLQDRKGNPWVYRGPHDAADPGRFRMQYYYRTLPGFYFPSRGDTQPPVGTLTPYLRNENTPGARNYLGDDVTGDANPSDRVGDGNPLWITYRPVWPQDAPVLLRAESLALPKRGLPAIRGQSSLKIVYQQSEALAGTKQPTAVLHDPTREKEFRLGPPDTGATRLDKLPESIRTQDYRGKTYFPNLPPHLAERFFFQPNRGDGDGFTSFGALVFKGQFVDEALGEDYLLLNVLTPHDATTLKALCLADDERKVQWDAAIEGLGTTLERFAEDPGRPGTFRVDPDWDPDGDGIPGKRVGGGALAEITDDEIATDSFGLSATGPGTGFLTLIAGNSLSHTPSEDPVSLLVIRVVDRLYPGEIKVIESPNPLAEKVTLQQVVDLGGRGTKEYEFEWRIASPVDGLPPLVYQNTRTALLPAGGSWLHLPLPLASDRAGQVSLAPEERLSLDVRESIVPITDFAFDPALVVRDGDRFTVTVDVASLPTPMVPRVGGPVVIADAEGRRVEGTVTAVTANGRVTFVATAGEASIPGTFNPTVFHEGRAGVAPESIVFTVVDVPTTDTYSQIWLSMDLDDSLGARVYLDGTPVVSANLGGEDTPTGSTPAGFHPLGKAYRLSRSALSGGTASPEDPTKTRHLVAVEFFSDAGPGVRQAFDLTLEAYKAEDVTGQRTDWLGREAPDGIRMILGETADVRSLSDNYVIMRYRPRTSGNAALWSRWTEPQLVEGYIKRVLKGINPFNQRVKNLFENRVNTDVSILTQAGPRWEGDVALNLDQINHYGLIEIYETVLRRGRMLSIDAGINFPGANDALLLAAGYLNDLYMMLGNEAFADAANPTIGIGTKDHTYGDIATALFAFKGQVASVLEEELALMRGRDDFLPPGTDINPVYNRLIWNYTRGIDSGEVIYALNYNILENQDQGVNGVIDADDARRMFPQGHGDAYGHYLTALKGYYSLFMDTDFDWVPRTESVLILNKPVQVDYSDERKFATAAAAVARAGRQIFDLTWRQSYQAGTEAGWQSFEETRTNTRRALPTTRFWGSDHWASRTLGGAYVNWVVGNALLPEEDPDPEHEGIQRIDRRTVPELRELVTVATDLQTASDNAEAHLSPLGLPAGGLAFDINPNQVLGREPVTHFEQVYERASGALRNAVVAFDDAKDVTRLLRSESDSLAEYQSQVAGQEAGYQTRLTELYGSPYPDDVGAGKTYPTDYKGEDFLHFMYVDIAERSFPGLGDGYGLQPDQPASFNFDYIVWPNLNETGHSPDPVWPADWWMKSFYGDTGSPFDPPNDPVQVAAQNKAVNFTLPSHGFYGKPPSWGSRRDTPGRIQQAISDLIKARTRLAAQLTDTDGLRDGVDLAIDRLKDRIQIHDKTSSAQKDLIVVQGVLDAVLAGDVILHELMDGVQHQTESVTESSTDLSTTLYIAGFSVGSDSKFLGASFDTIEALAVAGIDLTKGLSTIVAKSMEVATQSAERAVEFSNSQLDFDLEVRDEVSRIGAEDLWNLQISLHNLNLRLQEYEDAQRTYRSLLAEGNRIRDEREAFRQRAAAVIQGFRTRDAAFRIFRNEKLERYKSLFDLSARYTLLAANAYDYETGLLNTPEGRTFVQRIISSRALGVVKDGQPQFAGSNTGDPGLSSVLAEMKADWDVLKGRLGFNNPDAYGTTASLRTENFRILPGVDGDDAWRDTLQKGRTDNLLRDADVLRYCLQIQRKDDLPVPGIVVEFATTISDGLNLFGKQLAAGDHAFGPSSFATKIHAVGVALEGYQGMDQPVATTAAVGFAGGVSPSDPTLAYLDPKGLAANPYVYLIPVGLDSMRTPPLGDQSEVRTWSVDDVSIPLPFNIGASDFSSARLWQSADSLTEPLFASRKHQSFRPVASSSLFGLDILGASGELKPTQFTNRRLIGRSAWNSRWKLVIPGSTLLNNPDQGLDRFIQTVRDIRLHFVTYSYSGN